jgi:two-component system nitrate/nitrite response regulator NarL
VIDVIVLTPVRLLGDALAGSLNGRLGISVLAVVDSLAAVRDSLAMAAAPMVLIDVTHGLDLFDTRAIASQWPHVTLVALGLTEQRQQVIQCGRAGFAGYVPRSASIDVLCRTLMEIVNGSQPCPPEIAAGMLRALYRPDMPAVTGGEIAIALTRRESEVLALLGRGFSNKEIGNDLCLSVATVKHHVHHILEKLNLPRRAQAMRRVQDEPWLAHKSSRFGP